ncbi:hypothetical protein [Candidatus Contendibacter odensensis]|uniref:Uncharacterized protein n=1 Tax=Candidatus Contendobacter odensis Run_B_J11 TaxID=1400861 RepID=A0A7U7J6C3_9GAMM|nr:hypothetical protein [Candidatus Contendobacter odensis]CDH47746.1 hypothetical protein BN874_920012 [Candidatus Contendobacter odensis Run_B_J11]
MTEQERPAKMWQRAAHDFLDARGFAPGPSLFRAIAHALAAFFAESRQPLRIPLALEWFQKAEVMAMFADQTGPLGFADVRRVVAIVAVEFPQVTVEHVRVALNALEDGGLLESAYREIDSEAGAAVPVSAEEVAALLRQIGRASCRERV